MKRELSTACILIFGLCADSIFAQTTNTASSRIGIYDSRAIAYAYFWSKPYQSKMKSQVAEATAAKRSGETNKLARLAADLRDKQDTVHREIFSTASVDDALSTIKNKIPEIEKQTGIIALVSKWNDDALKKYSEAEKVDVTDLLVNEFIQPTAEQLKTIESFKKTKPMPLDKINELIREGKI
jgi:hypothetical protein